MHTPFDPAAANTAVADLEFHPLANVFPLITGSDFDALVADIKAHGLHEPIWLYDGQILDGRHRFLACSEAGIEPRFITYEGRDPLAFVISLNLKRRHLDESQRAMVAARLATLKRGDNQHAPIGATSQDNAAELLNVGRRSVQRAKHVIEDGADALVDAVDAGKINVTVGSRIARLGIRAQEDAVALVNDGKKPIEALRITKVVTAIERHIKNPTGKFRVLYCDPPWDYGQHQMPEISFGEQRDHYPVQSIEKLCELPVGELAEDDAVLFMWVTAPIAEKAFKLVHAWGFEYKAQFVWDKIDHVMGHYNSVRHELLYICTRGSCQPEVQKLIDSVQSIKRSEHSRKPHEFYEIIETLYPRGRKLEIFHRGKLRDGWRGYGFESEENDMAEAV